MNIQKDVYDEWGDLKDKKNKDLTTKELCVKKEKFNPLNSQLFVSEYMDNNKALLLYHKIGSGKTCASILIALRNTSRKHIYVITPASLIDNYVTELCSPCGQNKYMNESNYKLYMKNPTKNKKLMKNAREKINKHFTILSHHKFVKNAHKLKLANSVIIIDEVQNIISNKGKYYKIFYKYLHKAYLKKGTKIVLLTATPIYDKPDEIALTLNLLPIKNKIEIGNKFYNKYVSDKFRLKNGNLLKPKIQKLISFYPGANKNAFPKVKHVNVYCKMSDFQWKTYRSILKKEGGFPDNPRSLNVNNYFYVNSRSVSNIAFPNKKLRNTGFKSFQIPHTKGYDLKQCSNKLWRVLNKIKKAQGPVFVYSEFLGYAGIGSLVKILEDNGYKDFTKNGPGIRRFAVWSGSVSKPQRRKIQSVANNKSNKNGDKLQVLIGSPAIAEGVSLLRFREVHLLEPYWNTSRVEQVIGRIIRFCSHADLPAYKRNVTVYYYFSTFGKRLTIDLFMYKLAQMKQKLNDDFEKLLKDNAVDKLLFQ